MAHPFYKHLFQAGSKTVVGSVLVWCYKFPYPELESWHYNPEDSHIHTRELIYINNFKLCYVTLYCANKIYLLNIFCFAR